MALYLVRRTAFLVVSLLLAMVVLFFLLRVLPGDPSNALLSVGATNEQIAAAQRQVGSDQPLLQQFFSWFGSLLTLNLGESFISSLPVGPEIAAGVTYALQGVMRGGGTAASANPYDDIPIMGKTSTTDDSLENWLMTSTTKVSTATWVRARSGAPCTRKTPAMP